MIKEQLEKQEAKSLQKAIELSMEENGSNPNSNQEDEDLQRAIRLSIEENDEATNRASGIYSLPKEDYQGNPPPYAPSARLDQKSHATNMASAIYSPLTEDYPRFFPTAPSASFDQKPPATTLLKEFFLKNKKEIILKIQKKINLLIQGQNLYYKKEDNDSLLALSQDLVYLMEDDFKSISKESRIIIEGEFKKSKEFLDIAEKIKDYPSSVKKPTPYAKAIVGDSDEKFQEKMTKPLIRKQAKKPNTKSTQEKQSNKKNRKKSNGL